jgi:hypothetical protein
VVRRNKLISNYLKGVIAFVDDYWKVIHRAAGWDALRCWCWVSTLPSVLVSCIQFMVDGLLPNKISYCWPIRYSLVVMLQKLWSITKN